MHGVAIGGDPLIGPNKKQYVVRFYVSVNDAASMNVHERH
jgi:hypothetical protein